MSYMIACLGVLVLVGIAVLFSENRKHINLRLVGTAFALQALFAALVLVVPFGKAMLTGAAGGVQNIVDYANVGIEFLFGPLASDTNTFIAWPISTNADGTVSQPLSQGRTTFIMAFRVLPAIVFVSSLVGVLYHLRVMQLLVITLGSALRKIIGISRVESLCASANIFIGMVESPLVIRPYLPTLTHAQLFTVMGVGLSTSAGATLIAYASILGPDSVESLVAAAFMAAPGGLLMAKLLVPDEPDALGEDADPVAAQDNDDEKPVNVLEAAADGAMSGLRVAAAVAAMLLSFTALLAMLNGIVGGIAGWFGFEAFTLETLLGWLFAPIAFVIGIPWDEAPIVGNLLGQKIVLNEVIAFAKLAQVADALDPKSYIIAVYAICGFANLAATAVILGGLGTLLPARKSEIARFGLKAVLCGALANLMSAAIASILLSFQ
ncbi:MAG: nucleoside transporter C-terminal domain-containing protein [Pseudomonadota bacterium]